MKIELHILQNFAPSNLNRDDSGLPKDCEFGGYRRARISSQCLKRSIRYSDSFDKRLKEYTGVRTKRTHKYLTKILTQEFEYTENEAEVISEQILAALKLKLKEGQTQYLYYTDKQELRQLAKTMHERNENYIEDLKIAASEESMKSEVNKAVKNIKSEADAMVKEFLKVYSHKIDSADIALFGRMLADQPTMKIDAACQVAHALSTNRVSMDFDYFTAVDDLNPDEETGAGMIGNVGYNSSCFYRYALIDFDQLSKNLAGKKDIALQGILGFVEGSIEAIPTGKQNSFAAQNPPAFVMVSVKNGSLPASLANAFERPTTPFKNHTLTDVSIRELDKYWSSINETYGIENDFVAFFKINKELEVSNLKDFEKSGRKELIESLESFLTEKIGAEE